MNKSEKINCPELDGQSSYLTRFDDAGEAAVHIRANVTAPMASRDWTTGDKWTGYESGDDAVKFATTGNDKLVALANEYLAQIQKQGFETSRGEWLPSVAGAYPVVGDYLAGRPNSMRHRQQVAGEHAPVRLILDTTSSGGITAEKLQRRGAAMLALAMALIEERPVELWQLTSLNLRSGNHGASLMMVRCPTTPVNLGVCAHIMTSQQWTRGCGYGYLSQCQQAGGGWSFVSLPDSDANKRRYHRLMRAALDLSPQDILVDGIFLTDPLVDAPVAWINGELAKLRGMVTEDNHA